MPHTLLLFELGARLIVTMLAIGLIWLGAARMQASSAARIATATVLSALVLLWAYIARALAIRGTYNAVDDGIVPWILIGLFVPIILAAIVKSYWKAAGQLIESIPVPALIATQFYRVAGLIFLALWAARDLPWQFAMPAGIGDILTGLAAIPIAIRFRSDRADSIRAARAWCYFGIADLVVAVTCGGLTSPGRAHLLALTNPNHLISQYPLVMIPTFAVPLALMLHFTVLSRLPRAEQSGSTDGEQHVPAAVA